MCCECCKEISKNECCKTGLGAVKRSDREKYRFNNTREINCSIDIDSCLKDVFPEASRWDYLICYKDRAFFVEIHPANNGENIKEVLKKLDWLKSNVLRKAKCKNLKIYIYWIATGRISYSTRSRQRKQIESKRIKLVSFLSV